MPLTCLTCDSPRPDDMDHCPTCRAADLAVYVGLVRHVRMLRAMDLATMDAARIAGLRVAYDRAAIQLQHSCRLLGLAHSDATEFLTDVGTTLMRLTPTIWTNGKSDFRSCPATWHPLDWDDVPIVGTYV